MKQSVSSAGARVAENGAITGGRTTGRGILIHWQDGPLVLPTGSPVEPNGAFVEGVIQSAIERLEQFQATPFANAQNVRALNGLRVAMAALEERDKERAERGVGGTHAP